MIDRINQVRGISLFASVIERLLDVKDYEDSERIAAKVAASLCAVITRGTVEDWVQPKDGEKYQDMRMRPGMIYNLQPGESVETINSTRPNPKVEDFRTGQLRAAAGGIEISYSSFAKDYNGTYSAQRQELVEQYGAYGVLSAEFINQDVRDDYETFVSVAIAGGALKLPKDIDPASVLDALYIPPAMPWLDLLKEAEAFQAMEESAFISGPEIIRRRGGDWRDVLEQESTWRKTLKEKGINQQVNVPEPPSRSIGANTP
jgi:lambda family phage portal protein